jgi:hypothetical protein
MFIIYYSANLCSLAGRYDNPIPTRCPGPHRCFKNSRARIWKRLWSPGIDSEESISPAYVACRAGTTNRFVVPACQAENRFLGSLKGLQIRALISTREILAPRELIHWKTVQEIPPYCTVQICVARIPCGGFFFQ